MAWTPSRSIHQPAAPATTYDEVFRGPLAFGARPHTYTSVDDDAGRLTRVYAEKPLGSGNMLTSFSYSYNVGTTDTSLRQTMTALYAGSPASTSYYCYDGLGRLLSADTASASCPNASAAYQYAYDSAGNMTAKTISGTTTSYTVNAANQLSNTGQSFDANGSQTADPATFSSASYNTLDQTTSITPTGGSAIALAYAGLNQAHRVTNGAIGQVNDQLGLNEDTGSPNTFFTRDPGGSILGERHSGSYYFLQDGLGSTVAVTDSTGTIIATYKYDPYGNPTATTGSLYQPIRYAGGYWDQNTTGHEALYKFGQRYYDPSLARWTQPDPVNNPLDLHGWNGYTYAGDDPINSVDPTGTATVSPCAVGKHRFIVNGKNVCPRGSGGIDLSFNAIWNAISIGGALYACFEGGQLGLSAGVYGAAVGCLAAGGAFYFAGEQARQRVEHVLNNP
ncbi:MAG: RHS repeat-associated core domain-containing protein [Gaiellaceae bacterium]